MNITLVNDNVKNELFALFCFSLNKLLAVMFLFTRIFVNLRIFEVIKHN